MSKRYKIDVYRVYRVRSRLTSRVRYVAEIQYVDRGPIGSHFFIEKRVIKRFRTQSSTRASHVLVNMVLDPSGSVSKARKTSFAGALQ